MKNKRSLAILFFVLTVSVIIYSCTKELGSNKHDQIVTGETIMSAATGDTIGHLRICGSEFQSMNLAGYTYAAVVDSIGKWHNDCQKFVLNQLQVNNIGLNTDTIQSFLKNKTHAFFATKGITPQNTILPNYDLSDTVWHISSYSSQARTILTNLKAYVKFYVPTNHSAFVSNCLTLKTSALNLPNGQEALSVGVAVSVAINSFTYWKDNAASWSNYLTAAQARTPVQSKVAKPCAINLKQLGGADIVGAIGGGEIGAGGGPIGVVAGGLLGASVSSSYNIIGQSLQCAPGVVGTVSRWLSDWF